MIREEHEVAFMGAPQNPGTVMSTVVNVQPDTVVRDHIVWSMFNILFLNPCCLGLGAFAYSVKSRDRRMVGDVTGAQSYGSTAKSLNICALILGILMTIGLIVLRVLYPGLFFMRIET